MTPEALIARLRGAHPDMEWIFMRGSCFELYEILRVVWPEAEPWYSQIEGHVFVKIGPWWYDIRGRHRKAPPDANLMTKGGWWPPDRPHRWSKRTHLRIRETGTPC